MEKDKSIEKLEQFMLDIDELDKLTKYNNEVNFFKITGIENKEIKHSNFLKWLLNANANHNIGDKFVRKFMQKVIKANKNNRIINSDIIKISLLDYYDFLIRREWNNLDIFMVSDNCQFTITIENKIYSSESKNQTINYRNKILEYYKDYTNLFIFLTPEGKEAQDSEYWCSATYYMIKECIEEILTENEELLPDAKLLLKNYVSMLGREILMDNEIKKICNEIYKKHRDALELIFQYRPNEAASISNYIQDFIEQNADTYGIIFDRDNCSNTYIRFTTRYMNELIPKSNDHSFGWNNGYSFLYEIEVYGNYKSSCVGTISNTSNATCIKLYKITQANSKKFNISHKNAELPNIWARVFRSEILLEKDQIQNGLQDCEEILKKNLIRLFTEEIPNFEKLIKTELNENNQGI